MQYLKIVPKNALSRFVGDLVKVETPKWLASHARDWFQKKYKINMDEAELPIHEYPSISKLFTRKLKPGIRPIGKGVVHPCDANLTVADAIESDMLIQAKGKHYSLNEMVGDPKAIEQFLGGATLTYYLCPTDYHRVHSPVDGVITKVTHIPGALWPVNNWSVANVAKLFTVNERMVFHIQTQMGPVVLVMVGATNVGKISVSFDSEIVSNRARQSSTPFDKTYKPAVVVTKGQELGIFHMGSTVVMLYPPKMLSLLPKLGPVHLGESV